MNDEIKKELIAIYEKKKSEDDKWILFLEEVEKNTELTAYGIWRKILKKYSSSTDEEFIGSIGYCYPGSFIAEYATYNLSFFELGKKYNLKSSNDRIVFVYTGNFDQSGKLEVIPIFYNKLKKLMEEDGFSITSKESPCSRINYILDFKIDIDRMLFGIKDLPETGVVKKKVLEDKYCKRRI